MPSEVHRNISIINLFCTTVRVVKIPYMQWCEACWVNTFYMISEDCWRLWENVENYVIQIFYDPCHGNEVKGYYLNVRISVADSATPIGNEVSVVAIVPFG